MGEKFKFNISEKISVFGFDRDVVFNAELKNGVYEVTWECEEMPMYRPVDYTVEEVKNAFNLEHWILVE